ncbi:MAG: glycosyltransferase [Cyclobacteriaceae bacterium]
MICQVGFEPRYIEPSPDNRRLCIVIPCYNESRKLKIARFKSYLADHPRVHLTFVNDGSGDDTLQILTSIKQMIPEQTDVINLEQNSGKAEAVRAGILYALENNSCESIGYLDADLAVSLEECDLLSKSINKEIDFCFGSRILRMGSVIERKPTRFLIGRAVATIISQVLQLKVYDTQCGCKLFHADLAQKIFREPFISKWLFDVEIFFRILQLHGRKDAIRKMVEIPLNEWIDQGDSKVKPTYFFRMLYDLLRIRQHYRNGLKNAGLVHRALYPVNDFSSRLYQYRIGKRAVPFRVNGFNEFVLIAFRIDIIRKR